MGVLLLLFAIAPSSAQSPVVWSRMQSPTNSRLVAVAYGNGSFVAVGDNETILKSVDGRSWEKVQEWSGNFYIDVEFSDKFMICGYVSGGHYRDSLDGSGWRTIKSFSGDLPYVRIPAKADTDSDNCRTPIPIELGQWSERSDGLGLAIKNCPK